MLTTKRIIWLTLIGVGLVVFAPKLRPQSLGQETLLGNEDELASIMAQEIRDVSQQRDPTGTLKRFNQVKSLGCFEGTFEVLDSAPDNLKHGLFAQPGEYPATLRFANASKMDDRDKDLRGLSIRVSNVPGDVAWGQPGLQDFVLNSHPALFAATPEEFLDFIKAQKDDSLLWFFLNPFNSHLKALFILLDARDRPTSPFDIRYWSTTPFQLGNQAQAVKYSVASCSDYTSPEPADYSQNYLREAMHHHLEQGEVCLDFMLQLQTDADAMPIEDTSVEWDEDLSPFIPVARIRFSQQAFFTKSALQACEQVSFNPWQALKAHRPLGRMNYVRKQIYAELAAFRQQVNQARE